MEKIRELEIMSSSEGTHVGERSIERLLYLRCIMYVIILACNTPRSWYSDISKPRQCLQKSAAKRKRAAVIGPSSLRKSPGGCIFVAL